MPNNKLTIWCNNDFTPSDKTAVHFLLQGVGEHRISIFGDDDSTDSRIALQSSDIAFGYPSPEAALESAALRWVHLNSAGYSSYDHDEIKRELLARGVALTNSSSVYDEPCAQHLLAMITSLARKLPAALDSQRVDKSWTMQKLRASSRLLSGQTVLILGFGAIARRLVELLRPLQMNLIAVRRTIDGNEPIRVEHVSKVDDLLPFADHLVNILPANDQTNRFLDASRLANLKPGAIVYNIGRGSTLDQDALRAELLSGNLAAAYLDVTSPEPLPSDHPLWTTPNCFITPHSGGGHSNEQQRQVDHFLENLRRFERGEELVNRIF
jgi:phosphoglycerate dehydrogenase-like enzyme